MNTSIKTALAAFAIAQLVACGGGTDGFTSASAFSSPAGATGSTGSSGAVAAAEAPAPAVHGFIQKPVSETEGI